MTDKQNETRCQTVKAGHNVDKNYYKKIVMSFLKKRIEKIMKSNETIIILIICFGMICCLFNPIRQFIDEKLVNGIFSIIQYGSIFLGGLILLSIAIFFLTYQCFSPPISDKNKCDHVALLTFIVLVYLLFRICGNWAYFPKGSCLSYSDILILSSVMSSAIALWPKNQHDSEVKPPSAFFEYDLPTTQDSLQRTHYAESICDLLINTSSKKIDELNDGAFAMAINGSWGSGKTSFLMSIKNYLRGKRAIVVDCDPWMHNSKDAIVEEFVKEFSNAIFGEGKAKKLISDYLYISIGI